MPDELTVSHAWKEEKKPREYNFDGVFGPEISQDQVGSSHRAFIGWSCHIQHAFARGYYACDVINTRTPSLTPPPHTHPGV